MWGTMFNLIQLVFNPFGAARTAYGEILPNMAINDLFGASWDPWDHFRWVQRGRTGPSIGEIQCSTLFNRCSTQIGQLRPSIAKYCQLWPKMAVFGGPGWPQGPFLMGPKGLNWSLHMWDTMFNPVQPVFNPNRAARPVYGQILPNMAKNGRFWGPPVTPGTIFDGSKGVELVLPYVRYNVQPCSTGVQPK